MAPRQSNSVTLYEKFDRIWVKRKRKKKKQGQEFNQILALFLNRTTGNNREQYPVPRENKVRREQIFCFATVDGYPAQKLRIREFGSID